VANDLTYVVLDGIALRQASLSDDALDPVLRRELVNAEVLRLWEEFKDDPFYRFTATLAVASDTEILRGGTGQIPATTVLYAGTSIITAFSETSITRSSGVFPTGALLAITFMRNLAGTVGVGAVYARVVEGGATARIEVIAPSFADTFNVATDGLTVHVLRSQSALSSDFSPQYFNRILQVKDNVPRATQGSFDQFATAEEFAEIAFSPTKSKRVAYYHRAGAIDFFVPATGPALGVVSVEYAGMPGRYTKETETEAILIPPQRNALLIAAVTAAFAKNAPGAVPSK